MIKEVSYERVFNLGNYENHRIGCVVEVENGDHVAAFAEARAAVKAQHAIFEQERQTERDRLDAEYKQRYANLQTEWKLQQEEYAAQHADDEEEDDNEDVNYIF